MKVIFDVGIIGRKKFGIAYAVLEQMKALKALDVQVVNLAVGWRGLNEHVELMQENGFAVIKIKIPLKMARLLNFLRIPFERFFLGKFDVFYQIGVHANRVIPARKYFLAVHDMVSKYYEEEEQLPYYTAKLFKKVKSLITVSEFSKKEITKYYDVLPKKIKVIANGCNFKRFNQKVLQKETVTLRKELKLPSKYFFMYGGSSPRKNIKLIEASASLLPLPVVIAGNSTMKKKKNIISLGYLEEKKLELILKNSVALLFPSLYEGFGLPVLEALACGVSVLCAASSSLPEVSGGNALFFDPYDKKDFLVKVRMLLKNKGQREKNIKNGLAWVKNFSWQNSAEKLKKVFKE